MCTQVLIKVARGAVHHGYLSQDFDNIVPSLLETQQPGYSPAQQNQRWHGHIYSILHAIDSKTCKGKENNGKKKKGERK